MTSLGVGVYLGGNLIWATIISMVLAGIGFPIVWGVLGGSMPRSGGEYIYNSRIIHPIVGIGESFGNAFVWIMWIYVLAPWMADPGMVMMSQFMGWTWLYNPTTEHVLRRPQLRWGCFVIATIANIIAFLFVVFGIKWFARIQKVVMIFGIGGCAVLLGAISYSRSSSARPASSRAGTRPPRTYGSIDYAASSPAAGEEAGQAMPTTWNWFDTFGVMVAGSWLFAYSYCITFIAGEVKRPDKTIILSNLFAIIVPGVFMLWAAVALYGLVEFDFFSATQFVDNAGSDLGGAYTVPWSTNFLGLARHGARTNKVVLFIAVLSFLAFNLWWIALSYLAFPRIIFAWGMDRMGPKWFTDINPRFASPVKNHILCFVLGQIMIAVYVFWQNEAMQGLAVTGARDLLGVRRDRHRGPALPLRQARQGHLGRVAVQDLEDRSASPWSRSARSSTSSTWASWPYFFFFLPDPAKRSRASPPTRPSSSP